MDAREEFERIKGNTKDLRKAMVEKGQYPTMNERDLKDLEILINIIDTMDKQNETIDNHIKNKVKKDLCLNMIMDLLYSAIKIDSKKEPCLDTYNLKDACLMYLLEQFDKERFNMTVEMKRKLNDEY